MCIEWVCVCVSVSVIYMKRSFFQVAVVSILLYGCTTWTLTKRLEKKLDGDYTRMLRAILNKSWRQQPRRHQLYGHLSPPSRNLSKLNEPDMQDTAAEESDVLQWTLHIYGRAKAGQPAPTYIQLLCKDTGCSSEDQPGAMNNKEKWRERVRDICASGMT